MVFGKGKQSPGTGLPDSPTQIKEKVLGGWKSIPMCDHVWTTRSETWSTVLVTLESSSPVYPLWRKASQQQQQQHTLWRETVKNDFCWDFKGKVRQTFVTDILRYGGADDQRWLLQLYRSLNWSSRSAARPSLAFTPCLAKGWPCQQPQLPNPYKTSTFDSG